jgi:hypothetical protein
MKYASKPAVETVAGHHDPALRSEVNRLQRLLNGRLNEGRNDQ